MIGIIYNMFAVIDSIVYGLASALFRIIFELAEIPFFSDPQIKTVADRVYIVVGVLMLFKLVISAVQYMINPDAFDDKEKGLGGILKKTAISIALIVVVPIIFQFLMAVQTPIIKTLPSVILGTNPSEKITDQNLGFDLSFQVLSTFIKPKAGKSGSIGNVTNNYSGEIHDIDSFKANISKNCPGGFFNFSSDNCTYEYNLIISTLGGAFLCWTLMIMVFDIAVRTIKMGIIRMLAPIPISGYIVSKDSLNKFVKTATTVYLDLFIRMGIIYFIIFALNAMLESGVLGFGKASSGDWFRDIVINVALVFGLLTFASKAPKFLSELLGLPDIGSGDLADMFKPRWLSVPAAGFKTAMSNYTSQKERWEGKGKGQVSRRLRAAGSAALGFGSATARGLAMTAMGKDYKDIRQNASKAAISARDKRSDRADNLYDKNKWIDAVDENGNYILDEKGNRKKMRNPEYYNYFKYQRDVMREKLGIPSGDAFFKVRYDAMESIGKLAADAKGHGVGKMNETPNRYQISFRKADGTFANADYETINAALGYEELSMEQVRNMYEMAKNGVAVQTKDGKKKKLDSAQVTALGSLVQIIEKRTSYLKEAELMALGDPAAAPNAEKLILALDSNRDMFNDKANIMAPIISKLENDLKNFRVSNDPTSSDYHKIKIGNVTYDMSGPDKFKFDDLHEITRQLSVRLKEPDMKDTKYVEMRNNGADDSAIAAELARDRRAYEDTIIMRADILTGIKDSFEEVAKLRYREGQIADNKAKKAQQAVNNDKK